MSDYFLTDDERGRILWRGTPDDHAPEYMLGEARDDADRVVFDAAAVILTDPDDAIVDQIARRVHVVKFPGGKHDQCRPSNNEIKTTRATLIALREVITSTKGAST